MRRFFAIFSLNLFFEFLINLLDSGGVSACIYASFKVRGYSSDLYIPGGVI